MGHESLWIFGAIAVAATLLLLQHFRVLRIERAWRAMAQDRDWVFTESSGSFASGDTFFLVAPSPSGGIQISWLAGARGSSPQTVLRTRVGWSGKLRIDPVDKLAGVETASNHFTGDRDYDAEFRSFSDDSSILEKVLDETWRAEHRKNPIALQITDETLEARLDEIIYDEERMFALLRLFTGFQTRLEG